MRSRDWQAALALAATLSVACVEVKEGTPAPPPPEEARIADAPGIIVPDEELQDQDGRPVRLRDLFAARVVAVNFVYTTCTTICSPMTAVFARLARDLGPALGREARLVTISLDPATDTPERLRAYADRFERREGWTFLTGPPERVARVRRALGGAEADKESHAPWTLLGREGGFRRAQGIASSAQLRAWMTPYLPLQNSRTHLAP